MREKCRSEPYGEGLTPTIVTVRRGSGSSVESLQMELQAFSGLLRGSVRGRARRVKSQICDDAMQKPQSAGNSRRSLNTLLTNVSSSGATTGAMDELKQQGIQAAESLASDSVVAGHCASAEETTFDDSEEWAKIAAIMQSFGAGIARESVFVRDYEADFTKLLAGTQQTSDMGTGAHCFLTY
ncbi:uncharacterized protein LOC106875648 isoform X4 [Octopus bimaculoides]|uniref:uncharacterized protein LOC106875648 isoform X4 n=1 Tax=Octopus bimaculoides TaxID=37653 RepID=UPI00071D9DB4|nr:uncharacterized protein LOC106875648 isoform X4 [Octopus bimaculoides]|eukprot:XP_014779374.1 PREDICTED: uncharacterized protein LOC106875648 isoform X3 [Octopus bimaculoides]